MIFPMTLTCTISLLCRRPSKGVESTIHAAHKKNGNENTEPFLMRNISKAKKYTI